MWVIGAMLHIALFATLITVKTHPTRLISAGSPYGSMTAYVTGAASAAPAASAAKPVEPKRPAITKVTRAVPADVEPGAGTASVAGTGGPGQESGPVRLGSGNGNLTLIKKVQPIYPPIMQAGHVTGSVVLDAIIHADGSIGDIKVLQSTNDAFSQSAINAVKQWRYTAPGFEGILTVNVNFTLN